MKVGKIAMSLLWIALVQAPFARAEGVIVHGEGFAVGFTLPSGWECNCEGDEAAQVGANALIFKKGENWRKANPLIYLRVNSARDAKIDQDLAYDKAELKKKEPKAQFKNLHLSHPTYPAASYQVSIPRGMSQSVVYLSPTPFNGHSLSVAMHRDHGDFKPQDNSAFQSVVTTVRWLGSQVKVEEPKK